MDINAIANDFTNLCKAGKFEEAGEAHWSPDIVSIEPFGGDSGDPAARGIDAVRAKGEWWYANHEVHNVDTAGPFMHGDQFTLQFHMDLTVKASGDRMSMDEIGLYTVKDGKIVEERFFYSTGS